MPLCLYCGKDAKVKYCTNKCFTDSRRGVKILKNTKSLSKDDIINLYVNKNKTLLETACLLNCCMMTLLENMKNFDIKKIKNKKENYTGKKIGKLLFLRKESKNKLGNRIGMWKTICDCGNKRDIFHDAVRGMRVLACKKCAETMQPYKYKYIAGHLYNRARVGASVRGMEFNLSKEYIDELFGKQKGKCGITGIVLIISGSVDPYKTTASLDRIDSDKGYIEGNVQWIHKRINIMKGNMPNEEFFYWCKLCVINNKEISDKIEESKLSHRGYGYNARKTKTMQM